MSNFYKRDDREERALYKRNPTPCVVCGDPLEFVRARRGDKTCGPSCRIKLIVRTKAARVRP